MSDWMIWKREKRPDESQTSLTFTDVIFGLVFTEIFTRASALYSLSTAVDVHLALSLAVAVGSYIGYRGSLKRGTYRLAFFNLPLLRFVLDLFMIFLYYVLAVTPDETKNPKVLVDARTDSLVVLLIFAAYLAWDLVSRLMVHNDYKISFQGNRMAVTLVAFVAAGVVAIIAWTASSPLNQHLAIVVDSFLIAIAILYRWAKDCIVTRETPPATVKPMTVPAIKTDVDAIRDAVGRLDTTIATIKAES
jgi:hypothetical protein